MYDINDKKAAVRNVQSMLSELGYYRSFISGFYDVNTSGAVKRFQKEEGLDENGIVNAETLSLLHKRNSAIRVGIKNTFPITKETNSTTVREINALMREVLEYYFGAYDLDISTYYSEKTEKAADELYTVFNMSREKGISSALYERLQIEVRSIRNIAKNQ